MALYYFHLRDHGDVLLDPQGRRIDDPAQIPGIALHEVRSLISHDVLRGEIDLSLRLEIEDSNKSLVYTLQFADAVDIKPAKKG